MGDQTIEIRVDIVNCERRRNVIQHGYSHDNS